MRHSLVKLLSLLLCQKAKDKQKFIERFDPVERNKALIKKTRVEMAKKEDLMQVNNQLSKEISKIKNFSYILTYQYALDNGFVNNYNEHLDNIKLLKANLSASGLKNLETILSNVEKSARYPVKIPELWLPGCDRNIQEDYFKELEMSKEIERVQDFFRYKNYKLPVNFFQPSLFLYNNGMHKLKTLGKMSDSEVIIDAGFCIADSALVIRNFTDNKIIGFEPALENIELAKRTIELNNLKNIIIEDSGLGDKNESLYYNTKPETAIDVGAVAITSDKVAGNSCSIIKLDDYVKKYNLQIGLIKADIEGYESKLLQGAIETIKSQRPRLLISIYHNYNDFYKIKPWIESLNLGYEFDFYHGLQSDAILETLLIAEVME